MANFQLHRLHTSCMEISFNSCSSLEKLLISRCPKLSKIEDWRSTSACLKELVLSNCPNLSSISDLEGFSSLRILEISICNKLEIVPIGGQCSSLEKLHITSCENLSKIGDGLSASTYLKELKLSKCPNLSSIPDLEGFSSLRILDISFCNNLEIVPIGGQCSSLEKLHISFCRKLSKIGDGLSTSTSLEEFKLSYCPKLSSIPDLEGFSCLQILEISNCDELKIIPIRRQCSSLEKLHIFWCQKLSKIEDWQSIATCLKELKLSHCGNLNSIPDLESLRTLDISKCDNLEIIPTGRHPFLEKLHIFQCEKISKVGDGFSISSFLTELRIRLCTNLSSIPDLEGFPSLQSLCKSGCNKLEIVPITERCSSLEVLDILTCEKLSHIGNGLSSFTCLKKLRIVTCPNLRSIPSICHGSLTKLDFTGVGEGLTCLLPDLLQSNTCLRNLTLSDLPDLRLIPESVWELRSLDHLTIKRCPTLRSIPNDRLTCLRSLDIGGFSEELEEFPGFDSIQRLSTSLKELRLFGWEKLSSLPYQLRHLTALEELEIQRFHGIEALPDWLGNLSSVKSLRIVSCDKLMYLPPSHVMRSLSELIAFEISACPQLEARCSKKSGPEWPKISHIGRISIKSKRTLQDLDAYVSFMDLSSQK